MPKVHKRKTTTARSVETRQAILRSAMRRLRKRIYDALEGDEIHLALVLEQQFQHLGRMLLLLTQNEAVYSTSGEED